MWSLKNDAEKASLLYHILYALFNSGYVSWARQEHAILITAMRVRTIIILILHVKN